MFPIKPGKIIVATKNEGKLKEVEVLFKQESLNILLEALPKDFIMASEKGNSYRGNACLKATFVGLSFGAFALADDSGIEVEALEGKPGVLSARFGGRGASDLDRINLLMDMLRASKSTSKEATFVSWVVLYDSINNQCHSFDGILKGILIDKPRGNNGFGFDPIFFLPAIGKTLAELSIKEKNVISHRGKALQKLINFISS